MRFTKLHFIFGLTLFFLFSCNNEPAAPEDVKDYQVFHIVPSSKSGVSFKNQINETEENNHLVWESIYNGGGVGIGDINNDGLMDFYLSGNMTADKLYLNKGNLKFEDITTKAGINESDWSTGVTFADVNNDGFIDIYICKMSWHPDNVKKETRKNRLYINNGDQTFTESAEQYGVDDSGHSTHASFFDYDKDGLLDLYVMNAPSHRYDQKLAYMNAKRIPYEFKDHLYKNKGNNFEDVTLPALGDQGHAYGLGLSTQDFNQDGWTDIYVANDFERPDLFLINDKKGGFTNQLQAKLKHISYSSMGMDVGDINNDGYPDIAVLDMQSNDHVRSKTNMPSMNIEQFWQNVANGYHFQFMSNMVQLNNGDGFYSEVGQLTGMASTDWSWSILLQDFNNDRYNDAIITNGINRNIKDNDFNIMMEQNQNSNNFSFLDLAMKTKVEKVKNFVFENKNGSLHFEDVSDKWGFNHDGFSFGAAYADLDNDGDLDVITNNNNEVAHLYENQTNGKRNHLRVQAQKDGLIAFNTKAYLIFEDDVQMSEQHNVRGYQATSEPFMHFGLATKANVPDLYVVFPDGKIVHQKNVDANQLLIVDHSDAKSIKMPKLTKNQPIFVDLTKQSGIEYFHVENQYNDFDHQILIPHMESKNGPFVSIGDVNGDGLDDMYIGASKEDFGLIYLQAQDGKMIYRPNPSFLNDKAFEDMGSCFFDVDNDGDLDLYVASGGSEDPENNAIYQDRLYINQGNGLFERSKQQIPSTNSSKVIAIDVNQDGFTDLFVGGRMEGNNYPLSGHSHLLMNNKGTLNVDPHFEFQKMGMVTDAISIDINHDNYEDLVVIGEWMHPTFLINQNGIFVDQTDQYLNDKIVGWWFDIEKADLDGDGTPEILLGNIGMNNKYKASHKKPLKLYSGDFDQNNQYDIVLAKQTPYGEVPVRGFECSSEQLPMLKDKFGSYSDFAHAQISDIIDVDQNNTVLFEANEFRSGYLKLEKGQYQFTPFPPRAQISAVQGIVVTDADYDKSPDVILAGNHFDAEVETTRHDASVGLVLLNKKGNLQAVNPIESGLYLPGNVKDLKLFEMNGKKTLLVTNNNNRAQVVGVR